jgi:chromosome condensin MukBEF ATPase and DNA-binding subunit MukB
VAQSQIEQEIAPWLLSLERKLNRDQRRIQEYYQTIISEIRSKCHKKKLEGEALDKELSRIEATESELSRKLVDLQHRYALTLTAQVHSLLVVWLQTVHIECELIRKKSQRTVLAIYNPYTRIVEPLRCEITNLPVTKFVLNDAMQILGDT